MRFLRQLTINLDAVPTYVEFNSDWTEQLDKEVCRLILQTEDPRITDQMKEHFLKTFNLIKADGKLKVKYNPRYGLGRRYADENADYWGNLCIHAKLIKNTIFAYLGWIDYDQRKGHPTILAEVGRRNGSVLTAYEEYIAEGGFDAWCDQLIPYYSAEGEAPLTRGDIKNLFNATIYGGGHNGWVKEITWEGLSAEERNKRLRWGYAPKEMRNKKKPHELYNRFLADTQFITRRIYDANPQLVARLRGDLPDDSNAPFSKLRNKVMSSFCGILENEITFKAYQYCVENGLSPKKGVDWGYDGFTTPPPPPYTDHDFHLNAMNEYVREKTGFKLVRFEKKAFDPETIIQSVIDARRALVLAEPVVAEQIQLIPAENVADAPPEPSNQDEAYMVWKEEFEKEWCKIRNLSVFLREYRNPTTGMFEKNVSKSEKDLIIAYKDKCYNKEENGKTKRVCCIKEWLEDPNMRCYDDAQVIPPPEVCPEGVYNLWREFPYEAQPFNGGEDDPEFDREAVQAFASHLETICGNSKEVFDYVCGWFAHMFQVPAEKPECCLNFVSEEGTGKTIIMNTIGLLCGAGRKLETSCPERDCWGNHNVLMTNAYLVVLSETDKRNSKDADGKIKELITDKADGGYTINPKGKDQFDIRSLHRVIRPTNTTDPTKTHAKDRRNVIIRCSDENVGNTEYFTELIRKLKQPNALRSLYWSFKSADLSNWDFRKRPITDYHKTIIESSRNPLDRFMEAFTFAHRGETEMVLYGAEMLAEFKAWRDGGGYSFGEKIDEGTLIKKLKLELKLPADTIVKMTRGSRGIRSRYDIGILKKHYGVGLQIPLQQQNADHLPQDEPDDDGVETETEEYQEENEDEPL
jgi:hypothetical protein